MTVGERIKQRREELGYSQEELARMTGYKSRSSINKIELSRDLPLKKVEIMAKALDVEPGYLMGWNRDGYMRYAPKKPAQEKTIVQAGEPDTLKNLRDMHMKKFLDTMEQAHKEYEAMFKNDDVNRAMDLYALYQKASPEARKAVEVLLKFEPPQS